MTFRFQIPHCCNIKPLCEYCSVRLAFEKSPVFGDLNHWWQGIQQLQEDYPTSDFNFIYGEPFAFKNLVSWMGMLSNKSKVDTVSNLVETYKMIEQYFLNPENLTVTASYHPHYWDDISSFYEEVVKIKKTGTILNNIFLLGYPPYMDKLKEYEVFFKNNGLNVFYNAFYGQYDSKSYPESYSLQEQKFILSNNFGNKEITKKSKGKLCNAAKYMVYIKWNGDVASCYTPYYYKLGNILTDKIIFPDKPQPCLSDICSCPDMFSYLEDDNE